MMLLGLPDDIHEEKPSFLQFKKNALRTDGRTDGRTDPLIEMRGRILKKTLKERGIKKILLDV